MEIILSTLAVISVWCAMFAAIFIAIMISMDILDIRADKRVIKEVLIVDAALCIGLPLAVWLLSLLLK